MKILSIVGARPNFMKIAPLSEQLAKRGVDPYLVHTGQHYDEKMSKQFFEQLSIPKPDVDLEVGSGSQAEQTAEIMKRLEPVLVRERPDLMIVVGDVTSTMAAAITAAKLCIPVAHVESGLRSFDRTMPEEINRLLTDAIADYHFTTEESANKNLQHEGVDQSRIFFVGNTMIDTLLKHISQIDSSTVLDSFGFAPKGYGVVTLHRPSNVDTSEGLRSILGTLQDIALELPLVFPIHPRTRVRIGEFGLSTMVNELAECRSARRGILLTEPLGYLDFMKLVKESRLVLTDSGGIQEETSVLGVPCLTLRENTERPVTVTMGTNLLVGSDRTKIIAEARKRLNGDLGEHAIPPLWDGKTAERIVSIICDHLDL
jgi:UDP-N-acetylglucosamine 2-epimerase (non-hydrolysing)